MASELTGVKDQPYFLATGATAIDVDPGLVADYAALVGNHKEGTAAERAALSGKKRWEGLLFTETDTGLVWSYLPTATGGWACISGGGSAAVTSFSTNWAGGTGGQTPICYRQGNRVDLVGSVTIGASGGGYTSILTVPSSMRPPTTTQRFVGVAVTSTGAIYHLGLTAGVLGSVTGYNSGSGAFNSRLPLNLSWYLD